MSANIKANTAYRAGLITELGEEGERKFDAILTDTIEQGTLIFNDFANGTPANRAWKTCPTDGSDIGPYAICTKKKISGELKVTGITEGKGTVIAGFAIAGGAYVKASTHVAGAVDQWTAADGAHRIVGRYTKLVKYANSNDGNHALVAAAANDVIEIELEE